MDKAVSKVPEAPLSKAKRELLGSKAPFLSGPFSIYLTIFQSSNISKRVVSIYKFSVLHFQKGPEISQQQQQAIPFPFKHLVNSLFALFSEFQQN